MDLRALVTHTVNLGSDLIRLQTGTSPDLAWLYPHPVALIKSHFEAKFAMQQKVGIK